MAAQPRQSRDQAPAAGIARRLASMVYDVVVSLGALIAAVLVPYLLLGALWNVSVPGVAGWAHIFLVLGAYFGWFWSRRGQTPAMSTWRIRLVEAPTGAPVSLVRALLRYLLSWPSLLLFGVGVLWALVDRDRQFLHDRLAGTRIVVAGPRRD
jgi:uncharacterized RDD family membrane protein YckC